MNMVLQQAEPELQHRGSSSNYLNAEYGLRSWLLTVDHKRIAILYLISVSLFFLIGGLLAMAIRMELLTPQTDLMSADTYNKVFSMHGITMVFFVLIPAVPAVLGNFVLPMMLGARDLAFPKINLLSWYCYVIGGSLCDVVAFDGRDSEVIACFSRKRIFGYTAVAFSSVVIAVFGFFVLEHHMFIMGVSQYSALVFSLLTMLVAVPSAIKTFNWALTLQQRSITFAAPMIYALCFLGLFVIGGCTGVFLGCLAWTFILPRHTSSWLTSTL
jgi:heme/copper-type cytochrome/quinol oxidase subunit 1